MGGKEINYQLTVSAAQGVKVPWMITVAARQSDIVHASLRGRLADGFVLLSRDVTGCYEDPCIERRIGAMGNRDFRL